MLTCDVLIKNATVLMPDMTIAKGLTIALKDGRIAEVSDQLPEYTAETVFDDPHLLWMPGLTDGHLHTSQQFLKGSLLDEKPVIWKRINVPFEASLTEQTMALSARLAAAEMIRCGTTCFVDDGGPHVEAAAEEYLKIGMRGALTWQTTDGPKVPGTLRVETDQAVPRLEKLYREYNGKNGLLQVYYSITSLMACTEELFRSVFAAAKDQNIPAECHMNEYTSEVLDFMEKYGDRPFEYLDKIGALTDHFTAAHCLILSESEIAIIRDRGLRVVHCPFSNCGKGVGPTPRLLAEGIPVAFGSDGAGHGGLDLFREMRAFRCVMNVTHGLSTGNPQIMPAKTILHMALDGGARALMRDDLGRVQPGCLADLIAIDLRRPQMMATSSLVNSLVESACGGDVVHSVIHGNVVMKDRELLTIDEDRLYHDVEHVMGGHPYFSKPGAWCRA